MLLIVLALIGVYFGVCTVLARNYIHPARVVPVKPAELREVMVGSRYGPTPSWCTDGLANGDPSGVVFVMAHGYGGTRESWSQVMHDLAQKGFDSLAISMPGQDASPAKFVGFGISEGHATVDAVKWVRAKSKHPVKVVVLGISMGGAATWLATSEDPGIDGIVTEGAYARFDQAMNQFFERKLWGGSVIFAPVVTIAKWMTGLKPEEVLPVDSAVKWKGRPALVIQAGSDTLITEDQGRRLAEAAACPIWLVPGAEHAQCYEVAKDEYLKRLVGFADGLDLQIKGRPAVEAPRHPLKTVKGS